MWKMTVKTVGRESTWEEPISVQQEDFSWKPLPVKTHTEKAEEVAKGVIDYFNRTSRSGESPRELVNVFFEDNDGLRYP